ncbi:MAG: MFS transporter, partial [Cereibacter changlensis]
MTLALSMLLASLGASIANVALPTMAAAFSAPFAQVQAVVVSYLAGLTIFVVIAGRLGDRCGLRPMLIAGLGLFTSASLLCALAPDLWLLVAARGVQGAGAAFLMTLSMALMRQTASEARLGRAMGLLGTVSALGTALGPALGGLMLPLTGWRGVFWFQAPLSALALILAVAVLSPERAAKAAPRGRLRSVLDRSLLPNLLLNVLVAAVMMTTLVVGPFYLSLALGLSVAQVGLVMTVGPALSIVSGAPSGRLVDHLGSRRVVLAGLLLLTTGTFALAILPGRAGVAGYLLAILVLTPGYQLFQAANNTAALADARADLRGAVSGLLNLSRNLGLIAGSTAMGALFAFGAGTADL